MKYVIDKADVPYALANYIYQRDGGVCQYCGTADRLITDHVVPFLQGGHTAPYNLVVACVSCNCKKKGKTWVPRNIDVLTTIWPEWSATIRARGAADHREPRKIVSYKIEERVGQAFRTLAIYLDRPIGEVAEEALLAYVVAHINEVPPRGQETIIKHYGGPLPTAAAPESGAAA